MQVLSPFETLLIVVLAIFYVNDGMLGVNTASEETALPLPVLLQQAKHATQSWERLLFASGGALELSKCFAYMVYWDLTAGQDRLIRPNKIADCDAEAKHFRGPIGLTHGNEPARNLMVT
jgi:hypothetical protein